MKTERLPAWVTESLVAFILLSRLPMPHLSTQAFARGAAAVWAYPLVGLVLGGLATLAGLATLGLGLPVPLAAGLVLLTLVVTSGAMHEDGLADVADGFWGGHTPRERLAIMLDSRIGTYGVLALIVATGLRWGAIAVLLPVAPLAIPVCAALSRAGMPIAMVILPHAREGGLSHSVGAPAWSRVGIGGALAGLASLLAVGTAALPALVAGLLATAAICLLAQRKIAGQTGDVLGCTQQAGEIAALMALAAILA